jgi:superfamily II DNA or RNA helicase
VQFLHVVRSLAMMNQQSFQVGDVVFSRRQRWRVVSIRPYSACNVLALTGASVANAGRGLHVITPFDEVETATRPKTIRLVRARRWRRRCRELLAAQGPADRLQAAQRARIDLRPHQLEPALAIVRGLTCRVLLADEVGLGKTIQAGLIASELRERGVADRILVLTPAGLREQWADELTRRFHLAPALMDASSVRRRASMLPVGINPWTTVPIAIASIDYVKRPEVQPALTSCRWDLVIVDEAHGVAPGSDRLAAVGTIGRRASYVVLLTATPHSGSTPAFDALRNVGALRNDRLLIFRRSRLQVALSPGRRVHRVWVEASPAERAMHATLSDLGRALATEADSSRDAWLMLAVLQKRALSSANALARTVARRLNTMDPGDPDDGLQLVLPLADAGDFDPADEAPGWRASVLRDSGVERRLLKAVAERAAAAAERETKLACLERLLRRLGRFREQAIVFTEYRDTLLHLRRRLSCDCAVLHGGLTRDERRLQLERFAAGRCHVLLATDAAGEGLNLHERCRTVINLELPWNPMRLEQRIGRVDRIGQRRRVHAFHLIARGTGETRILEYLQAKLTRVRADISAADPLGGSPDDRDEVELAAVAVGIQRRNGAPSIARHDPHAEPAVYGHLEPEAATELQRLLAARQFLPSDADAGILPNDVCLATTTRLAATREQLNGRLLAIVRTEVTDAFGRPIAAQLVPLLVAVRRCRTAARLRQHLAAVAVSLEASVAQRVDDDGWHRAVTGTHAAFLEARRQRDGAILDDLERRPSSIVQAGLFDRRALRERSEDAARASELREDLERSLATALTPTLRVLRVALLIAARW